MAVNINIETNPPCVIQTNQTFLHKEGYTIIPGPLIIKDGAAQIIPDGSCVFVRE